MVNLQNKIQKWEQFPGRSLSDRSLDFNTRKLIIDEALTWKDTPFVHQARKKGVGGDCVAVIIGVAKKFGYDKRVGFKDLKNYRRMPDSNLMKETLDSCFDKILLSEALPADILHFWFLQRPQHVAMLLEDHNIIHADETVKSTDLKLGGVVIHRMDDWWWSRVVNVYRFKGLERCQDWLSV